MIKVCEITSNNFGKEVTYLRRAIRWTQDGLEIEGDPKDVKVLLSECGMKGCKGVETVGPR
jgi:hypothetical protein